MSCLNVAGAAIFVAVGIDLQIKNLQYPTLQK